MSRSYSRLSIPSSDELTVGEKMKGELKKSKMVEKQEKFIFKQNQKQERQEFIREFSTRLRSEGFQSKMQKKLREGESWIEVLRAKNKYLRSDDPDLYQSIKNIADVENFRFKILEIRCYKLDSVLSWVTNPLKKPIVYRTSHDPDPNPRNYTIYKEKTERQGFPKCYGVAVFISI